MYTSEIDNEVEIEVEISVTVVGMGFVEVTVLVSSYVDISTFVVVSHCV